MLKLAVDCDVHTDHASYETQFGHVVRPTHVNTTWDAARFEVCAHRWVLVAEPGYGVALANHTSYGHDVTRHPRAGGATYSTIRRHAAPRSAVPRPGHRPGPARVPARDRARRRRRGGRGAGYALALPLRRRTGTAVEPIVRVDGPAYVEAVKLAEDGSGDVVVRLYEPYGARGRASGSRPASRPPGPMSSTCSSGPSTATASAASAATPTATGDGWDGTTHSLRPFQIVTLRFRR